MKRSLLPLVVLLFTTTTGATEPGALPDQYGNTDALVNYPQQPVLVIIAATRKLRHIGKWEQALRQDLPNLVSLRVADVTDEPEPSLQQVAERLQQRAPKDISILIDLDDTWANFYGLDTTEPCLLLFNNQHELVALFRGRPNKALTEAVLTVLREYFPQEPPAP